jgi:hypothetical protein
VGENKDEEKHQKNHTGNAAPWSSVSVSVGSSSTSIGVFVLPTLCLKGVFRGSSSLFSSAPRLPWILVRHGVLLFKGFVQLCRLFASAGPSLPEILYRNRTIFSRERFWQDMFRRFAWASECVPCQGNRKGRGLRMGIVPKNLLRSPGISIMMLQ